MLDNVQIAFNLHYRKPQFSLRERFFMHVELNDINRVKRWALSRYAFHHDFWVWLLLYLAPRATYAAVLYFLARYLYEQFFEDALAFPYRKRTGVAFADLRGIDEFRQELEDVVFFLKNRAKFTAAGVRLPKGILLVGPPGCGKTQIARALADEAGVRFFQTSASVFIAPTPGQGQRAIKNLFRTARASSPCIVFIDEVDSLGTRKTYANAPNDVVNTLLAEMDGFASNDGVLVIAATNREQALDDALKRAGRFDLTINIPLPRLEGRRQIFELYASRVRHAALDLDRMARLSAGLSGAEIQNVVNLAVVAAVREGRAAATQADLERSFEKARLGIRSRAPLSEQQKLQAAYREAAKAVLSLADARMPQPSKLVLSRFEARVVGGSLTAEHADRLGYQKREMLAHIDYFLAPKAVESIVSPRGEHSVYALADFDRAKQFVRSFLERSGMDAGFSLVVESRARLTPQFVAELDRRAQELVQERMESVAQKLLRSRATVDLVAQSLVAKEELSAEELREIVGSAQSKP